LHASLILPAVNFPFNFRRRTTSQNIALIGIGGVVAHSPLPHHLDMRVRIRRFRGLRRAIEQARKSERVEVGDGKRVRQGRAVRQTPGAVRTTRRLCGQVPTDPEVT